MTPKFKSTLIIIIDMIKSYISINLSINQSELKLSLLGLINHFSSNGYFIYTEVKATPLIYTNGDI